MKATWIDGGEIGREALDAEGVHHEQLDPASCQPALDALMRARGYREQDEVALHPGTPDLDAVCAKFEREHLHDEDEVRFVLEGEGVFEIRSRGDRWMRIVVERGDLIVVPERRNHRFLLTETKSIRCVRLFKDKRGWVPHYREA